MRVLFVNENIGGHATVHAHLRAALKHHDEIEPTFLDVPPPTLARRLVGTRLPGLGRLDLDLQPLRAQLALSDWVRRQIRGAEHRYDVLHVYTGNAGLRVLPQLRSMPSVVSTDATNVTLGYRLPHRSATRFTPMSLRVSRRFEKPAYDAATFVNASSEWVADSLRHDYQQGPDRLRVLPFGLDAPDFGAGAAPGTSPVKQDEMPRLVFVGTNLEGKGILRLHRLHQQHLADVCELVLVTPERLPSLGRNVRVIDDVTVGSSRLWEVLRASAAFVFPSRIDHAPNSVIEAFAAGLPVVGLQINAMPEMVPPNVGRLVPPDDDQALVAQLRQLMVDAELRRRLGASARQRFVSTYDASVCTLRLVDLLAEARERHSFKYRGAEP